MMLQSGLDFGKGGRQKGGKRKRGCGGQEEGKERKKKGGGTWRGRLGPSLMNFCIRH